MSRSKNAAVKDIDIDIVDILSQKCRYRVDIDTGDIDPPLVYMHSVYTIDTLWRYDRLFRPKC